MLHMANPTNAAPTDRWGKETEKQLDSEDYKSWREKLYVDAIPWAYDRFRELLERYSKIPPSEVEAEIYRIRSKAWEVAKYPCIGYFSYVRLGEFDGNNPGMQSAIERLKAPGSQETLLELGGFMCQTTRQLVFEGVDSARLYGTDLHAEFLELGYEQFRDRDTLQATFVAGDMLLPDAEYDASAMATTFDGKMSIVHASNFFHLFTRESQLVICERIVRFFRREKSAENPALLFGSHFGSLTPGEVRAGAFRIFLHDRETFQSLWDEVGQKTGTKWKVSMEVTAIKPPKADTLSENSRIMRYMVSGEA